MLKDDLIKRFKVTDGEGFKLSDIDPDDTGGLDLDKDGAKELLATGVKRLHGLQERLYAEGRWAVLIVLQAMDAAGKDGTIEHVMSGINPQGCEVTSFKAPSTVELRHDFLWRTTCALPQRGHIGIFNRSYYEEVLVARVHEEVLEKQNLPPELVKDDIWNERFDSIRDFERHLARNGVVVLKFFLHLSKGEQRRRLLERIDEPDKNWKFDAGDLAERKRWPDYMNAYEEAIAGTATKHAPWYVVPADNKWFSRLVVAAAIAEKLEELDPQFPKLDDAARTAMHRARAELAGAGNDPDGKKHKS
ncbi:polyphosphate kinase 2 family protein [Bosea sp. (in: a-proteobacteria)]|uniref:polyphosphate kinase 2 family protein n=1 Tax=Bosea sp. (in: a-proteobacteria) TaxID=1871050 RepID=UPI002FCA6611